MENLTYFLIALVIMIIFFLIDGISHQKFKKTANLWFHIIGISLVSISFISLIILEYKISLLIIPGILFLLIGIILVYLSYVNIKQDFLKATKVTSTGIYSKVRHPMYLGIILLFIGISLITSSILVSIYSLVGIILIIWQAFYEEKYLEKRFGKDFLNYKKQVPMLLPKIK
tara:strand:+ start:1279 stop:1794 length:516 start_codon:yes stop_codon:yes gene_type:complete